MYTLKVKQDERAVDVHCDNLIPLVLAVKDQRKYCPYAQFEIWDEDDTCLYDCRYDELKRVKSGWRIVRNVYKQAPTEDLTPEVDE